MRFALAVSLFGVLLGLAALGCGEEQSGPGVPDCRVTKHCPAGTHCDPDTGFCVRDEPCDLCTPDEICWQDKCYKKCNTTADCPPGYFCDTNIGGCREISQSDGDDEPDQDLQDTQDSSDPCGSCAADEVCWAEDGENFDCYKKCDPYAPACPEGLLCHLIFDESVLPKNQGLCVPPIPNGKEANEDCSDTEPCQVNLVCYSGKCRVPCNAWGEWDCGEDYKCYPVLPLEIGVCVPRESEPECSADNPCPEGFACVEGRCVPGTPCYTDADCPGTFVCEFGVCIESCLYMGCPSHMPECDEQTGHCTRNTIPCGAGCPTGYFCEDGRCWPECDPPCTGRQYCKHGANLQEPSQCVDPPEPDCRLTGTCPPGKECDQRTGFCVKRCPATCPPPTCCDYTTNYECGNCQSGVCSPLNPTGPCPLLDQVCVDGQCHTDPNICIPDGFPCSPASKCCSASPDAQIQCCVDATDPNLIGICCAPGQTCVPVLKICL